MGIFKPGRPSRQNPPDKPGYYYFRNKDTGKVDYVGETVSLKLRMAQHLASKALDLTVHWFEYKVADGESSSSTRREHESSKITKYLPRLNRRARWWRSDGQVETGTASVASPFRAPPSPSRCSAFTRTAPAGAVFAFTGTTHIDTGEPDAVKAARPVRRGADGKVLR